uniref:Zinc finger protein 91-like n=1 Tax=Saccoglossus kowalevskii TaxID=10224 RepID=A0ABM0MLN4_SACKO|nr:PREDICTED: zinc finger protein 91-like [Saccoglossus kowalevskii]
MDKKKGQRSKKGKLHKCPTCGKRFNSEALKLHQKSHLGDQRHKCYKCEKTFKLRHELKKHEAGHIPKKPFRCDICFSGFSEKSALTEHHKWYDADIPRECTICGKCTFSKALHKHMRVHSEERKFVCDVCGFRFEQKVMLTVHKRRHSEIKRYACDECPKRFVQRTEMVVHKRTHSKNKMFKCKNCHKSYTSRSYQKEHEKECVNGVLNRYPCHICGKQLRHKNYLKVHLYKHTGEKKHQCETCGKKFFEKTVLKQHKRIHTKEKPYKCDVCDMRFGWQCAKKSHMTTHTGEKPHKCTICDRRFSHVMQLKSHQRVHSDERPYTCKTCGMKFKCRNALGVHMRIHTGEKRYKCNICGKAFTQTSTLKKHSKSHVGDNLHKCDTCGIGFKQFKSLREHWPVHSEGKPYICVVCREAFAQESSLKEHKKIHVGERRFSCSHCGRKFVEKCNMMRHEKLHLAERPKFTCHICGCSYTRKYVLKDHLTEHLENPYEIKKQTAVVKQDNAKKRDKNKTANHNKKKNAKKKKSSTKTHEKESNNLNEKTKPSGDGLKKYVRCGMCGMKFSRKDACNEHEKMHRKALTCTLCNKKFSLVSTYKMHQKFHADKKRHKCDTCGKLFFLKQTLKHHQKTHVEKIVPTGSRGEEFLKNSSKKKCSQNELDNNQTGSPTNCEKGVAACDRVETNLSDEMDVSSVEDREAACLQQDVTNRTQVSEAEDVHNVEQMENNDRVTYPTLFRALTSNNEKDSLPQSALSDEIDNDINVSDSPADEEDVCLPQNNTDLEPADEEDVCLPQNNTDLEPADEDTSQNQDESAGHNRTVSETGGRSATSKPNVLPRFRKEAVLGGRSLSELAAAWARFQASKPNTGGNVPSKSRQNKTRAALTGEQSVSSRNVLLKLVQKHGLASAVVIDIPRCDNYLSSVPKTETNEPSREADDGLRSGMHVRYTPLNQEESEMNEQTTDEIKIEDEILPSTSGANLIDQDVTQTVPIETDINNATNNENNIHQNSQSQKKSYNCGPCHIKYENTMLYIMHLGFHGAQGLFQCSVCQQICKDSVEFNVHIRSHPLSCDKIELE